MRIAQVAPLTEAVPPRTSVLCDRSAMTTASPACATTMAPTTTQPLSSISMAIGPKPIATRRIESHGFHLQRNSNKRQTVGRVGGYAGRRRIT
jgi:hypothetical protein